MHLVFRTLALFALSVRIFGTVLCGSAQAAHVPAFPGAEGFGSHAVGGRGGRVIEVTNLNDAGPGSLREAVEAQGARTVVFRVTGTIELHSELVISNPFITIAGQTAPGDGITVKTHRSNHRSALTIKNGAHDVIIRYLRIRPGPHDGPPPQRSGRQADQSEIKDALQILDAERVIVDHCSFSWATDEVVSTFYNARDVTIQWCIVSEALVKARPGQALPGKGLLIGSKGADCLSVHHNLLAHNIGRNPMVKATGLVDVVNNVAFVPDKVAMVIDGELGKTPANFIGNYVLAPNGEGLVYGLQVLGRRPISLFVAGNFGPRRKTSEQPENLFLSPKNDSHQWLAGGRHHAAPITLHTAEDAFHKVLAEAGCTRPARDAVDLRVIDDVRAGRVRLVNDPQDVGGWPVLAGGTPPSDTDHDGMPDDWEKAHGLNPNDGTDGGDDRDQDGYTNLEEFLNGVLLQ